MSKTDSLNLRMKINYENRSKTSLIRRIPVIIRIDGRAFHSYCKNLGRPFDKLFVDDMDNTAIYLCQNIQGAKCAYVQSDEISILLTDYDTLDTQAFFDYDIQKVTSISASLATGKFNQLRLSRKLVSRLIQVDGLQQVILQDTLENLNIANFDSRCFNIPKEEVTNYFLARQRDAVRNSIQSVAQFYYSHNELLNKNTDELQEMIFKKGINWNDHRTRVKRGGFIVKNTYYNDYLVTGDDNKDGEYIANSDSIITRSKWEVVETPLTFNHSHFEKWL